MLGTEYAQPFAVGAVVRVVEVAEHVVALDARLEDGAERRLRLELVEAALGVTDGGAHRQAVAAGGAVHRHRLGLALAHLNAQQRYRCRSNLDRPKIKKKKKEDQFLDASLAPSSGNIRTTYRKCVSNVGRVARAI